jgi:hypothetical protein
MPRWLETRTGQSVVAFACTGVGFAITLALAVWASGDKPPNGSQSALLVILAGLFQLGGATALRLVGRPDPSLARSAVRDLFRISRRAQEARGLAETAVDGASPEDLKMLMGHISVHLSYIEEGMVESLEKWRDFDHDAFRRLDEEPR